MVQTAGSGTYKSCASLNGLLTQIWGLNVGCVKIEEHVQLCDPETGTRGTSIEQWLGRARTRRERS